MTLAPYILALLLSGGCTLFPKGDADKAAMNEFVHHVHGETQILTTHGERIANALYDVIEGKGTPQQARDAAQAARREAHRQRARVQQFAGPSSPELDAFRAALTAYLTTQEAQMVDLVDRGLAIAQDETRTEQARGQALQKMLMTPEREEVAGAAAVQAAMDALYATF